MASKRVFSRFIKEQKIDLDSQELYVQLIGNPQLYTNPSGIVNSLKIPLYIKDIKSDQTYKYEVDWNSLNTFHTLQSVDREKGSEEGYQDTHEIKFYEEFTELISPSTPEVITLSQLQEQTEFYQSFNTLGALGREVIFYRFRTPDGYKIIIPAIESLRYFYTHSIGQCLLKTMPHERPLKRLYEYWNTFDISKLKHYEIHLTHECSENAAAKLLYFLIDPRHTKAYETAADRIKYSQVIAPPPVFDSSLNLTSYYAIHRGNDRLVLHIVSSDMLNNAFENCYLTSLHPKPAKRPSPKPSEQPANEKHKFIGSPNDIVDDMSPPQRGARPTKSAKVKRHYEDNAIKGLQRKKIHTGKAEAYSKIIFHQMSEGITWTTLPYTKNPGYAIFLNPEHGKYMPFNLRQNNELETTVLDQDSFSVLLSLADELKKEGYLVSEPITCLFRRNFTAFTTPTKENKHKISKRSAEAYVDIAQTKRRKYCYFKALKNDIVHAGVFGHRCRSTSGQQPK